MTHARFTLGMGIQVALWGALVGCTDAVPVQPTESEVDVYEPNEPAETGDTGAVEPLRAARSDADGDGLADLFLQYDKAGVRRWQARLSTGSAFAFSGDWSHTDRLNVVPVGIADVDGDLRNDLVMQVDIGGERHWEVQLSDGTSFVDAAMWSYTATPGVEVVGLGDANGDGLADLFLQYDEAGVRRWQVRLSDGASFVVHGDWSMTETPGVEAVGIGDANGDGLDDLYLQYDKAGVRRWQARTSDGASFGVTGDWTATETPGVEVVGLGDADGDGLDDLYLQYDIAGARRWQVRLSSGTAFVPSPDWSMTETPGVDVVAIGDANGDGRDDLVVQYDHQGARRWQARTSTGRVFETAGDWSITGHADVAVVDLADADGDGRADLFLQRDASDGSRVWQVRRSEGVRFEHRADWTSTETPGVEVINAW